MHFIKSFSYINIRKKFLLLYILNVTDILFTILLLKTGLFEEVNGVMAGVVTDPIKSILIKVVLVGFLLYVVYKRMSKATLKQLFISNYIISFGVLLYMFINLSHVIWTIYYLVS